MFLLGNFLIRLTVVFFYYNIYVEWHARGGRGEGYVPVVGGAKGSIQQRVQTYAGETVTQCNFEWASDHFFLYTSI